MTPINPMFSERKSEREREKKKEKKREREQDFRYLLTLILFFLSGNQ